MGKRFLGGELAGCLTCQIRLLLATKAYHDVEDTAQSLHQWPTQILSLYEAEFSPAWQSAV
jgi:hypothetical protein